MESNNYSVLKIYASTTDRMGSHLLYESIVMEAKDFGISGITVYRGIMGYGLSSKISTSRFWELTEKLPVIIEIVDSSDNIDKFYSRIEKTLLAMPKGCLVTKGQVEIILKKTGTEI